MLGDGTRGNVFSNIGASLNLIVAIDRILLGRR